MFANYKFAKLTWWLNHNHIFSLNLAMKFLKSKLYETLLNRLSHWEVEGMLVELQVIWLRFRSASQRFESDTTGYL